MVLICSSNHLFTCRVLIMAPKGKVTASTSKDALKLKPMRNDDLAEQTRQEWLMANIEANRCNSAITNDMLTPQERMCCNHQM